MIIGTTKQIYFFSDANSMVLPVHTTELKTEEKEQAKPLFLIMQKKYFDQIEKGEKIEEYRDDTPFYRSRLLNKTQTAFKRYKTIILQEGYHKGARRMIIEVKQVTLNCYFTIHLGKVLERQNF